jgi:hypothetical protein
MSHTLLALVRRCGRAAHGDSREPSGDAPWKPRWRQASYTTNATVFDKLMLRLPGRMGIARRRSSGNLSRTFAGNPRVSGPNINASPG